MVLVPDSVRLILASTSPYRRQLLSRLGVPFTCQAPSVDEDAWKNRGWTARHIAEALAEAKALAVAESAPAGTAVLGGDQVCVLDDQVLGKPGTVERAVEQLTSMSGRPHQLITAICVCRDGVLWRHTDVTTLRMRPLTRVEIERYVAADQPLDCAGSYKLEERGVTLFERIESVDQTAITGLPLMALTGILRDLGFAIP